MFDEMFGGDPQDGGALITQLGGTPPMSPEDIEKLAKLKALIAATKPVTIRDEINTIAAPRPGGGPTVEREPQGSGMDRYRGLVAERQIKEPDHDPRMPLKAESFFSAANTLPAFASGAISSLWDSYGANAKTGPAGILDALMKTPAAIGEAVKEGNARAMVAPYQDTPPTVSDEFVQRGKDPGTLGRLAIDAVTDPGNLADAGMGAADDVVQGVGSAAALWFPKHLKDKLDNISSTMKAEQRAAWVAAGKDPK